MPGPVIKIPSSEWAILNTVAHIMKMKEVISLSAKTIEGMKMKIKYEMNKKNISWWSKIFGKSNIPEGSILIFSKSSTGYTAVIYPTIDIYLKFVPGKKHFHVNGIKNTPVDLFEQWAFIYEGVKIDGYVIDTDLKINPCFIYNENDKGDGIRGLIDARNFNKIKEKHPACNTLCNLIDSSRVTSISAHSNGTFLSIVAMLIADKNKVENIPYYPFAPAFDDKILKKFKTLDKVLNTKSTLFMNVNDFLNKTFLDQLEKKLKSLNDQGVDIDLDAIVINTIGVTKRLGGRVVFVVGTLIQTAISAHIEITENTQAIFDEWECMNLKKFMLADNCKASFGLHHGLLTHYIPAILSVFYQIELSRGNHTVQVSLEPAQQVT